MYTATTQLTINRFVPMNGVIGDSPSIDATISPPVNTSPQPAGQKVPVFTGDGQSIRITVPSGYTGSTQLTYQLFDSRYVLLGLAFETPAKGAGRTEFSALTINRDTTSSQIIVTDECVPELAGIDFNYVILVQEVATGFIGLIDPDIETDIDQ